MKNTMKMTNKLAAYAALVLLALAVPGMTGCNNSGQKPSGNQTSQTKQYTCPMHPEVVQDKPGKCPKCGMELVEKH
jgi:hypothetical protein